MELVPTVRVWQTSHVFWGPSALYIATCKKVCNTSPRKHCQDTLLPGEIPVLVLMAVPYCSSQSMFH